MGRKKIISLGIVILLILSVSTMGFAANTLSNVEATQSINKAINYLHSMQKEDGGFAGRVGGNSSRGLTSWVIMALEASGEDVSGENWTVAGKNPIDYLYDCNDELEETIDCARLLLALSAAGQGSHYHGDDLAQKIASFQQSDGQFGQFDMGEQEMINAHMWSILALASAGYEIPNKEKAKKWLLERQNEDGGFGWLEGVESDTDDTAAAVQTLIILGEKTEDSLAIKKALDFLKKYQQQDGGFSAGERMGKDANVASDAWAMQCIIAAGQSPQSNEWSINGKNGVIHLLNLQNADGSFDWKTGVSSSPVTMTAYTIMALAQKPHPVNIDYQKNNVEENDIFTDLSQTYWAYDEIMNLVEDNVLGGYPDGSFKPDNYVTRAEFTKFLVCGLDLAGLEDNVAKEFSDVKESHWAYKYISIAVNKGYVEGRPEGNFDYKGNINGAELATMLVRVLPEEKRDQMSPGPYWYSSYVKIAQENNLLYPDFQPKINATRAQCAYSIMQLRKSLLSK